MPTPARTRRLRHPTRVAAAPDAPIDHLRARIAERLRRSGADLPERALHALAESILADAIGIAAAWMEPPG